MVGAADMLRPRTYAARGGLPRTIDANADGASSRARSGPSSAWLRRPWSDRRAAGGMRANAWCFWMVCMDEAARQLSDRRLRKQHLGFCAVVLARRGRGQAARNQADWRRVLDSEVSSTPRGLGVVDLMSCTWVDRLINSPAIANATHEANGRSRPSDQPGLARRSRINRINDTNTEPPAVKQASRGCCPNWWGREN